jgi:hypothetical protein
VPASFRFHPSTGKSACATQVNVCSNAKTEIGRGALWPDTKWHKFSSHVTIAADGVHGKPKLPAPGKQSAGAGRNVPGDAIALENIANVPMADEHVPHSQPMQKIQLA